MHSQFSDGRTTDQYPSNFQIAGATLHVLFCVVFSSPLYSLVIMLTAKCDTSRLAFFQKSFRLAGPSFLFHFLDASFLFADRQRKSHKAMFSGHIFFKCLKISFSRHTYIGKRYSRQTRSNRQKQFRWTFCSIFVITANHAAPSHFFFIYFVMILNLFWIKKN